MMFRREWVITQLNALTDTDFVFLWNKYANSIDAPEEIIYRMDEFNDVFSDWLPMQIADMVSCGRFNVNDDWFVMKEYGNAVISDCDARYLVDDDDLIDDILDNPESEDYTDYLDDDDYRLEVKFNVFDGDDEAFEFFEEWFDGNYACAMYAIDLDTLLEEFKEEHPDK